MNDDIFLYSGWDKDGEIAMDRILRDIPLRMNCVSIGRIEKVYDQMADVSIIYKRDDGYVHPVLRQVPLLVLQGGKKFIKFPVANGDICLLLFCDRDISRWHARGEERQMPPSERNHNINDAIAICGLNYMGRGLGEDNYKGEDGKPAIQINGKGNHFVKWTELNDALEEFRSSLLFSLTNTPIAGNANPQSDWSFFPEKINIKHAKSIGIETGLYDSLADVSLERTQEELKQLQISELKVGNLEEMYKMLRDAKGFEGDLLRNVWNKHETKLRVHDAYYTAQPFPIIQKQSGEYGIFIDINRDASDSDWLVAYQAIFHEFFHNIDLLEGDGNGEYFSSRFSEDFVKNALDDAIVIENDIDDIIKKYKNKLDRSYLFDILGGVLGLGIVRAGEFGHSVSYWEKDYNRNVTIETFANMASAAITNIKAFNLMKDKLPKSYKMFIDILKKILLR